MCVTSRVARSAASWAPSPTCCRLMRNSTQRSWTHWWMSCSSEFQPICGVSLSLTAVPVLLYYCHCRNGGGIGDSNIRKMSYFESSKDPQYMVCVLGLHVRASVVWVCMCGCGVWCGVRVWVWCGCTCVCVIYVA